MLCSQLLSAARKWTEKSVIADLNGGESRKLYVTLKNIIKLNLKNVFLFFTSDYEAACNGRED